MPKKKAKGEALKAATRDERAAVEFIEERRWQGKAWCPYCMESGHVYAMKDRKTGERNKNYRWRCRQCNKMFTVRTGTAMEESRLPLRIWCYALWRMAASKKGVSALQLSRECEITHKTALFLLHRLRYAVQQPEKPGPLVGTVEVDSTYVGGRASNMHKSKRKNAGKQNKAIVFGTLERGGELRLRHPKHERKSIVLRKMRRNISNASRLMTDEANVFKKIGERYRRGHFTVNHSEGEYFYMGIGTNGIESAWALLKRQIYGTHHSVSKEHLAMYLAEVQFKWNTNKMDDGQRAVMALLACEGRRLMYRDHVVRLKAG